MNLNNKQENRELNGLAEYFDGNGDYNLAYVKFLDGTIVQGNDAILIQEILSDQDTVDRYDRFNFIKKYIYQLFDEWFGGNEENYFNSRPPKEEIEIQV